MPLLHIHHDVMAYDESLDELEGEIHSSPLCPCKAFVTDGLLIRWDNYCLVNILKPFT